MVTQCGDPVCLVGSRLGPGLSGGTGGGGELGMIRYQWTCHSLRGLGGGARDLPGTGGGWGARDLPGTGGGARDLPGTGGGRGIYLGQVGGRGIYLGQVGGEGFTWGRREARDLPGAGGGGEPVGEYKDPCNGLARAETGRYGAGQG